MRSSNLSWPPLGSLAPSAFGGPVLTNYSPVMGAADHLYNNASGPCAETRCICSAQITPPRTHIAGCLYTLLPLGDVSGYANKRWLATGGRSVTRIHNCCKTDVLHLSFRRFPT